MDDVPATRASQPTATAALSSPRKEAVARPHFSRLPESSLHQSDSVKPAQALPQRTWFEEWEPSGDPQCDLSQEFRHSGWHRDRTRVYHALCRNGIGQNRLKSFCQCGVGAAVYAAKKGPEDYKIAAFRCHDRFCRPCERERYSRVLAKILPAIRGHKIRALTLTLRGVGLRLRESMKKIIECFRQLRRLDIWKNSVSGSIWVLEIKRNAKDRWHVHIHALLSGTYIEIGWLTQAWHAITQDSTRLWLELARTQKGIASYIGKYATKGFDADAMHDDDDLDEMIEALRGVRMVNTTGCFRKRVDDADANDWLKKDEWELVGTLGDLWVSAGRGDVTALKILAWLRIADPLTGVRPPPIFLEHDK